MNSKINKRKICSFTIKAGDLGTRNSTSDFDCFSSPNVFFSDTFDPRYIFTLFSMQGNI